MVKMEVSEIVLKTLGVLKECHVPEDLRGVAFGRVFDALIVKESGSDIASKPAGPAPPPTNETDGALERFSSRIKASLPSVQKVFYEDDGSLVLGIASSRLEKSVAAATKQIALLVAVARQAIGTDDGWTSVDVIREICRDFKKLDANNFAATITEMDDVFIFRGKGKQRAVRVAEPGWTKAGQTVESLGGGG
jgi:hypothetical protein